MQGVSGFPQGLQSHSALSLYLWLNVSICHTMHLFRTFVLSILPFLVTAIPLAEPPHSTSRGIAIPIAKRATGLPLADLSRYESMNQNTIA
jgi:hypothetical protein